MIVVAIIGLLAAIAIPNFIKARQKAQTNACIGNLKQIQGAIQVWAIDNNKAGTDTPTSANLMPDYVKGSVWLKCPASGTTYTIPTVSTDPACPSVASYVDHKL